MSYNRLQDPPPAAPNTHLIVMAKAYIQLA